MKITCRIHWLLDVAPMRNYAQLWYMCADWSDPLPFPLGFWACWCICSIFAFGLYMIRHIILDFTHFSFPFLLFSSSFTSHNKNLTQKKNIVRVIKIYSCNCNHKASARTRSYKWYEVIDSELLEPIQNKIKHDCVWNFFVLPDNKNLLVCYVLN